MTASFAPRENAVIVRRCNATLSARACSPYHRMYTHAAGVALTELVEELGNLPSNKGVDETTPTFTKDFAQSLQVVLRRNIWRGSVFTELVPIQWERAGTRRTREQVK